jgi:hypothetical protein
VLWKGFSKRRLLRRRGMEPAKRVDPYYTEKLFTTHQANQIVVITVGATMVLSGTVAGVWSLALIGGMVLLGNLMWNYLEGNYEH